LGKSFGPQKRKKTPIEFCSSSFHLLSTASKHWTQLHWKYHCTDCSTSQCSLSQISVISQLSVLTAWIK